MQNTHLLPDGSYELGDYAARKSLNWTTAIWPITHHCQLNCPYCVGGRLDGEATSILDKHGQETVIQAIAGLGQRNEKKVLVVLTGGEPTLVAGLPDFCAGLGSAGVRIELQTNLMAPGARDFIENVSPAHVTQIMAARHGWAAEKWPGLADRYYDNFARATERGFTIIAKVIVMPGRVEAFAEELAALRERLPDGAIVLVVGLIQGAPRNEPGFAGAYPYAFTPKEGDLLDMYTDARRADQRAYREGAGWFQGMQCDAGRGYAHIDVHGEMARCVNGATTPSARLGHLLDAKTMLYGSPRLCPFTYCCCPPHGLWFGVDPWSYSPLDQTSAYFCRFGPRIEEPECNHG